MQPNPWRERGCGIIDYFLSREQLQKLPFHTRVAIELTGALIVGALLFGLLRAARIPLVTALSGAMPVPLFIVLTRAFFALCHAQLHRISDVGAGRAAAEAAAMFSLMLWFCICGPSVLISAVPMASAHEVIVDRSMSARLVLAALLLGFAAYKGFVRQILDAGEQ
jgi:hypothetical protein